MSTRADRQHSRTLRRLFRRTPNQTSTTVNARAPVQSLSVQASQQPDPKTTSAVDFGKTFLEKALESLPTPGDREIIKNAAVNKTDINEAINASYRAASQQRTTCERQQWTWTFGKRIVVLRNEAEKLLRLLDKVKSVGDIIANADPIHVGLPWAGIRLLLETAMSDSSQMGALMTGMSLAFYMSNRLKVYFDFFQRLSPSRATSLFETSLVKMYAHILAFFAAAIRTYQMGTVHRAFVAMWQLPRLESFASECDELARLADTEARGCDRELSSSNRAEDAQQWKQNRDTALQSLNAIEGVKEAVALLHGKLDLSKLRIATRAIHNTYQANSPGCLEGTRTQLIHQITEWADDVKGRPIFWLCGKAGMGKSTVSVTIANHFKAQHRLGGSFLFKRGESDRADARLFFPTIAKQLADAIPGMREAMASALDADSNLVNASPRDQFEKLILEPLLQLSQDRIPSSSIVLVIDALDECGTKDHVQIILHLLKRLAVLTPLRPRIFVTSRPDVDLWFRDMDSSKAVHQDIHLEVVQIDTIRTDLEMYLLDCFAKIKAQRLNQRTPRPLPADWPTTEEVQALVELASPLFIYASTVYMYLSRPGSVPPQERLKVLLQDHNNVRLGDPGEIYLPILKQMVIEDYRGEDATIENFKGIVGPIVLLADHLSINALAALLDADADDVAETLSPLYSVLDLPPELDRDRNVAIRPLHLSFHDFLVDHNIKDNRFRIDEAKTHDHIVQQCLARLSRENTLHYDMCLVRKPATRRASVGQQRIADCIPSDVAYACCHWIFHAVQSSQKIDDDSRVFEFLKQHFLHWVEAMSWLGRASSVITDLNSLQMFVTAENGPQLLAFLHDAQRFMLRNRYIVDLAPLQLYSSALIFTPEQSVVRHTFYKQYSETWPYSLPKVPAAWSSEVQRLEGHDGWVNAVAISRDGQVVASGSNDRTVRLWNATIGEAIQTLEGHQDRVNAVAISGDGQVVVSASADKTVRLWNAATGEMRHTLNGHEDAVHAVVIAHDGQVIASASADKTVRLWNATTGKVMQTLEGHESGVLAVAISRDGQVVASGSRDKTVRLWNSMTGEIMQTFEGHDDLVTSVAISRDRRFIASASRDKTVRLWNIATGEGMQTLKRHEKVVAAVAISRDDQVVVSGSHDMTVRLWNPTTGDAIQTLEGHQDYINDVAISHDGRVVVSGSDDKTVRLWNTTIGEMGQTLEGHKSIVWVVAISRDGQVVVSGSADKTVRLWNAATGEMRQTLDGHEHIISVVAISRDGQVVASGSADKTVRLWKATTGEAIQTLEGHQDYVIAVAISRDGRVVVSASADRTVRLWDAATGEIRHTLNGHEDVVHAIVIAHDGQVIASASADKTVRLWNATTGKVMQTLEGHESGVLAVAISRDGQVVASGSRDKTVRLWNSMTGEIMQTFEGHDDLVTSVAISRDRRFIASASRDKTVRLWNATTGAQVFQTENNNFVDHLQLSADEQSLNTNVGSFGVRLSTSPVQLDMPTRSMRPATLSLNGQWLQYMEREHLWLPLEYRGFCSASSDGQVLAVGHYTGTVSFFHTKSSSP